MEPSKPSVRSQHAEERTARLANRDGRVCGDLLSPVLQRIRSDLIIDNYYCGCDLIRIDGTMVRPEELIVAAE